MKAFRRMFLDVRSELGVSRSIIVRPELQDDNSTNGFLLDRWLGECFVDRQPILAVGPAVTGRVLLAGRTPETNCLWIGSCEVAGNDFLLRRVFCLYIFFVFKRRRCSTRVLFAYEYLFQNFGLELQHVGRTMALGPLLQSRHQTWYVGHAANGQE